MAGAGKTTAMVHRIERLVRERIFPARRILATSFGRANVQDLRAALQPWPHCAGVDGRTLHSLGRAIIVKAQRQGHLSHLRLDVDTGAQQRLLNMALAAARKQDLPFKLDLEGVDRADFLDYVADCKGNLRYANWEQVNLPPEARQTAGPAAAPDEPLAWYLDLYRLFEALRQQQGIVTFDDMLMTGWEALVRFPDALTVIQGAYDVVLVDEYQDINLAQSAILDLITAPHRNYMAIGDDDQTIYEWRGANPRFILEFAQAYNAQTYLIADNFRCPAGPLTLANRVIAHNHRRQPKRLSLTRGFYGAVHLHAHPDVGAMSSHIAETIAAQRQAGLSLDDMAVLVRINAQTPPIEQQLITRGIAYRIRQPFYERPEIETLVQYGRIAWIEQALQNGETPLDSPRARRTFTAAWRSVVNRPKRYLPRDLTELMRQAVIQHGRLPSDVIEKTAETADYDRQADTLFQFADDMAWLAASLDQPAHEALAELEMRLDYNEFLRRSSGFPQTGAGRAAGVDAFIAYARGQGSFLAFMRHVRELAARRAAQDDAAEAVTLATMHQAKGLEWPLVFIPQCNQGAIPFAPERTEDVEEERRLFYVALTRSKRDLHLYAIRGEPLSQFLTEATWRQTVTAVSRLRDLLQQPPDTWTAADALHVAKQIPALHLQRYFRRWWDAPPERQQAVAATLHRFFAAVDHHELTAHLGLEAEHIAWWAEIASPPELETDDFPGLEALHPQPTPRLERAQRRLRQLIPDEPPEPEVIGIGTWVHCDAGWGVIERIVAGDGTALAMADSSNRLIRLTVLLRPETDAEPVVLDLPAENIRFLRETAVYTCTRCRQFSAADPYLISDRHNAAAHDGVGASYVKEKERERPLTLLRYQERPPANPLS